MIFSIYFYIIYTIMKKNIHPKDNNLKITCSSCKNIMEIVSTSSKINIDVCSKCHPFYTNQAYSTRALGRVDKFRKKYQK